MIDTKTEELAALYVLDLLQGDERAAFEQRMAEEAELYDLVEGLSSGLHRQLKQFNGPERMDLLEGIQEKIGFQPHKPAVEPVFHGKPPASRWMQVLGVAAALLLALNLYQYFNPQAVTLENELRASRQSEQALLEENTTIKAFNKSWETEYMNLAERMLPFIDSQDGHGEFTVLDLVGVKKNRGSSDAGMADVGDYLISKSPLQFASINKPASVQSTSQSMGYAVWKADEQMGYLDLYNLAEARPGRAPFLWLRQDAQSPFVPVGYLPILENGTGTFYFEVEQTGFKPSEVLITEEPVDGPGSRPSRYQMMVGP